MFHIENLAGKRRSSPSSCCTAACKEFFSLVQKAFRSTTLSRRTLPRLASASGAAIPPLPTSPPHLPNPRTWKSNFLRHPRGIPTRDRSEPFHSRSEPIGPSRSEPIKTHVWLTVPAAALIPIFLPPPLSFVAPGVGSTPIRARALRHHMSPQRLSVLLWLVVTAVTKATAVAGGADRSDSPLSLPSSIRDHREAMSISDFSFFGTLFDQSIPNFYEFNTIVIEVIVQ